jgi:hypothetical protein
MGKNQDPGSGIRDKHPGSATLHPSYRKAFNLHKKTSSTLNFATIFILVAGTDPDANLKNCCRRLTTRSRAA